jgi:hypothetical protein
MFKTANHLLSYWLAWCAITVAQQQRAIFHADSELEFSATETNPKIPLQLIMTGKQATVAELPENLKNNVRRTQKLNPNIKLKYFGDEACHRYVESHVGNELAEIYAAETQGQFRGDICRAAVLWNEGGFYVDLDLQPIVPFQNLVDNATNFMSVFTADGAILNALIAVVPKSPILNSTIHEMYDWYRHGRTHEQGEGEWMGTVTLKRGLKSFMRNSCPDLDLDAEREAAHSQWTCASQGIRFYQEDKLNCGGRSFLRRSDKAECPPEREVSDFQGAHYGIFVQGGPRRIVAWPRMASCDKWWCGTR